MLEGVVARLLNQWLGKYVVDLDTENLNVGIFSGQVQLTELRLKTEALYELDLPIEVKFGTIGKISIEIPWNALLNQAVIIHIEDVHILAGPVVSDGPYDAEKEKRLLRASKRNNLSNIYADGNIIGGPSLFPEHLVTSIINHFQVIIQNIHVRYEDLVSIPERPLAAGLCISSITAETTNNKWKVSNTPKGCQTGYHLLKVESFSVYWNYTFKPQIWDWKTQYYLWRNAMTHSLQTFSMNNIDFDFLIKPMTCKIKFIINKSNGSQQALKLLVDLVLQDFTLQISREQFLSIKSVIESWRRMRTSRQFLNLRPFVPITKSSVSKWWKYAQQAVVEQRIRPYTWIRIATVRQNYRLYRDAYKKVLINPNDTELKLDLQKFEDNLSLINIIIAREHAKLMLRIEEPDCENSPIEKGRSFWSMLPSPERGHLCEMIGYSETPIESPNICHYVEHKYNLTISNFSLNLLCNSKEVLVVTLTQVLASAETRSTGSFADLNHFFKISARAEGFIIEGASLEDHLVPLISAEQYCNGGTMTPNVFSMDYETNPPGSATNCKLWCSLEAAEIVFSMHAVSEILNFFQNGTSLTIIPDNILDYTTDISEKIQEYLCLILNKRIDLNLDIKIPYLVIPEYGSLIKSGNLLILDIGRVVIRSELTQLAENLEEVTQMELEECAYSRVHIDLFHAQLLFCDSSENWRDARKETDTDMHLISKINTLVVFALCAKPDHKTLPKYKLNITVPSLKINISERKISLLLGFIEHLEDVILPYWNNLQCEPLGKNSIMFRDTVIDYWSRRILMHVRRSVTERFGVRKSIISADLRRASVLSALTDRSIEPPSEYSEESIEAWARCVDLPGLEDNISPHNNIQNLIRIVLGELCFVLSRSSERVDRPYLMLRIGKSCLDIATMDYGPALQLTIASISLTDKLHTNITGQYLDLIHVPVPSEQDFLMLLYRKVTADCPDFKSHFHSVEKSLVADFGQVNFLVHRDAIRAMVKYAEYLYDKIIKYKPQSATILYETLVNLHSNLKSNHKLEAPVPPGAVKFSNSIRLNLVTARLCDADCDLLDIKMSGLECDFMFRANERLVLRSYLSNLYVEHLTDVTLYSKVLTVDEEKVFEVKYVRHAPRPHTGATGILPPQSQRCEDGIMSDGSLRLYVGRMQVTLLYKLMLKLKYFLKPFCEWKFKSFLFTNWLKGTVNTCNTFTTTTAAAKLNLSITIHGPTLLLPQKTASPNLVVFNSGELNVENFFKETSPNKSIIENILMKVEGTTILRAVMTLNSSLETQEAILEPMSIRLDIKRAITCPRSANPCAIRPPSWEIDGIIDLVKITLGQRDLTTLLAVYTDNINEGHVAEFSPDSANFPADPHTIITTPVQDDREVRCLEAFFCQVESKYKDICIKLNLEGLELSLFCDCEEILSSPIRDLNHGLCRLEVGDTLFSSDFYSDHSLEAKLSVQSVTIVDIRPESNSFNNTIFQSHRDEAKANTYQISVSTPPVIDVSFHQNNTGDRFVDIIVERVCLTLSVPFLATLGRFIFESLPCERKQEGGIINHGYEADTTQREEQIQIPETKELTGLTIAIRMCKPEIVFLADAQIEKGNSFIIKAEILVDYSRHAMRENLMISLSNFHILFHALRVSEPYILLHPCDFEFSKCFKTEDGMKSTMTLSTLQMHLCSGIILTITDIIDDVYCHLNPPIEIKPKQFYLNRNEEKMDEVTDLWSSKRLSECYASESDNLLDLATEPNQTDNNISKTFIASISNITVVLELEGGVSFTTSPVILIQAAFECQLHDWSRQLHGSIEFHLQANYYNEQIEHWEPLVEPICTAEGGAYRPYEILVKIFQKDAVAVTENCIPSKDESRGTVRSNSSSGDEDTSSDGGMTFLRPQHSELDKATPRLTTSLAAFLEDSDMDTEDGTMEKLASAICDLFTGDWNESEDSDCGHSSGTEQSCDSESDERRKNITGTTVTTTEKLATYILIDSRDILNITLTSQAVHLLYDIMISYSDRRTVHAVTSTIDKTITLVNDIGPKSKVELLRKTDGQTENVVVCSKTFEKLDSGPSSPAKSVDELSLEESIDDSNCSDTKLIGLESDWQQDKDMMQSLQFPELTTPEIYKMMNDEQMYVEVPGFLPLYTSCPRRSWQKLLKLQPVLNNTKYYLMAKHVLNRSGRFLTIGSPLKICNETCYPLGLFYEHSALAAVGMEAVGEIMNPFGGTVRVIVLEPHHEYNVPLHIAYHCKLYLQPAYIESYQVSSNALWWPELALDIGVPKDLTCESKSPETDPSVFSLRVLTEEGPILDSISRQQSRTIPNYLIRLLAPLVLHNSLPYSIDVKIPQIHQQVHIDGGAKTTLYSLNIQKTVKLSVEFNYLGLLWTGGLNLTIDLDEKVLSMVTDYDTEGGNKQLTINVKIERTDSCELFFYAPYWIVNKTGLPLQIRGCVSNMVVYDSHGEEIILFSFKRQAKQAVRVRAYQSSWSAEFSLDAVGTSGLVVARDKERNRRYPMLLTITLSKMSPKFTKIVTLLPNFLVQNNTKKHLRFMEENERTDLWLDLTPAQCVPFWPETQSMQMYIKYRDSKVVSQNFSIARVHQTVLRMDKGGAVNVEVRGGHTQPFSITFKCYKAGDAPCRVDNMCVDLHLKVHQRAQGQVTLVSPQHSLLYTWDDPCADRILLWNVYNNKGVGYPLDIHTDGYGEVRIRLHTVKPGTVNITIPSNNPSSSSSSDDDSSEEHAQQPTTHLTKKTMRRDKVVVYWLCYMDGPQRTVMFTQDHRMAAKYRKRVHFERCDWEVCFSLAGVGLSLCLSQPTPMEFAYASLTDSPALWEVNIAHKWKMLTLELASWVEDKYKSQQKKCQLKDYVHIDFDKMYMVKPFYGELRRTYYPAVSLQYRRSDSHQFYRLKLNSFQVENEPRANIQFRILHPLINGVTKPFGIPCIECSCFKKHSALFEYDIYKSVTMDIQEFYVNIDRVFVERLAFMFEDWIGQKEAGMNIRADMNLVHMPLSSIIVQTSTTTNKAIIERLTLSPMNLQLVLSTKNPTKRKSSTCDLVDYMFSCLENSYSPVKQAKYSMISYEMEKIYTNIDILFVDVINHYSSQLLQQFHVNILGQEVLLNPFGFTVSKTGSTSETEQFTIGLDVERVCRCLLGHVHGSQSLQTLTLGRGEYPFVHSFDQEYRRRRRYTPTHIANFPETLSIVNRAFLVGVTFGFTGLFPASTSGGHGQCCNDGVDGFFKGSGKALASLMTRGGVTDCVDVAYDAIRRAIIMGERICVRHRLHRYININTAIKPFSYYEAMGQNLLMTISNGRFADTDKYWTHGSLNSSGKKILLITLQHIFLVENIRQWSPWEIEWIIELDDVVSVPKITGQEMIINVRQDENHKEKSNSEYSITGDLDILRYLKDKMEQALVISMEDKCWISLDH